MRLEYQDYGVDFVVPMPRHTKARPNQKLKEWADSLGCEVGVFHLNVEKRIFEDWNGEPIMTVQPYHLGLPEDVLVKELLAQLGE